MGSSPTVETYVGRIKDILDDIAGPLPGGGAGKVFDRPQHSINPEDFKARFLDTDDQLRGTDIDAGVPDEFEDEARHKWWTIWSFRITHYRHFSEGEGSFATFWNEVEAIKNAIRTNHADLWDPVPCRPEVQRVAEVENIDMYPFGGILCHRATLLVRVEAAEVVAP